MKSLCQHGRTAGNRGSRILANHDREICGYRDIDDFLGRAGCHIFLHVLPETNASSRTRAPTISLTPALSRFPVRKSNQYFRITIDSLIELVIGFRGFVDVDVMADNAARFRASIDDQIAKVLVVFLDRRLPAAHGDPLVEELGYRKWKDALLSVALSAWIRSDVHANDSDAAGGVYNFQA